MTRASAFVLGVLATLPLALGAQERPRWDPGGIQMERGELESLLGRLEGAARSPAYSDRLKERARRDAEALRARLEEGDFRVGDRVVMRVRGETQLSDTLPVERGPRITLPVIGAISLEGVLRSELEEHLTRELGQYIQDPSVQARALIRLSVLGNVAQPGFYTMPADMLVGEAVMRTGGPDQNANIDGIRIERGNLTLWSGEALQEAVIEGRTLDQLNLRAGDEIHVPAQQETQWWSIPVRIGIPIAASLLLGIRVFGAGF